MQGYSGRGRGRSRSRRAAQSDAIVIALTAQVLVCIVLLLAAVLVKRTDTQRYNGLRQEYDGLASGEQSPGSLQEIFEAVERWLAGFSVQQGSAALDESGAPIDEPLEDITDEHSAPATQFDYNYLLPAPAEDAAEAGEAEAGEAEEAFGQGGAFPVETYGADTSLLPPPEGATYARVALDAHLRPPVTGLVTSEFSYREHPTTGNDDFHNGIDIAAEEGRVILAALPGRVAETGWSDIYGNFIRIAHKDGVETFYAHCSELIAEEGAEILQGERIARVGATGIVTGPHLHFSVLVGGVYTDPFWVLQDNIRVVG